MESTPLTELSRRPDWFYRAVNRAVPHMRNHHGVAETILGIGREIDLGNTQEAKRVFEENLDPQLKMMEANPNYKAEKVSSQVRRMLETGGYPKYLKKIVENTIGKDLYPEESVA